MADQNSYVKTVIEVLHDGEKGFADIGEDLKDATAKQYFMTEARKRGEFATELESAFGQTNDANDIGGTVSGAIHRSWGDLKANLGGGDHTLLETAEQGEDAGKKAYEEALKQTDLTSNVRSILERQQQHIIQSHDRVRAMRNSTK